MVRCSIEIAVAGIGLVGLDGSLLGTLKVLKVGLILLVAVVSFGIVAVVFFHDVGVADVV